MTMANMNLIGVFVTKLWPVQALACGGGGGDGGATKNIISPKFSNVGDIITNEINNYKKLKKIGDHCSLSCLPIGPKQYIIHI